MPSSAATAKFSAVIHLDFEGAAPSKPCPLDPTTTCDVGHIAGYGQVVQEFNLVDFGEVDGCSETTGDVPWTLVEDPASTFMTREVYTECTPGRSADAPDSDRAYGNPFKGEGTFVISAGTGSSQAHPGVRAAHAGPQETSTTSVHPHDHDSVTSLIEVGSR